MNIPQLLPPDRLPPVVDQRSLEEAWRALMGELGFSCPQIYILFLEHDRVLFATHLEEVPGSPTPRDVGWVVKMFRSVHEDRPDPGLSLAFLYCRPGPSTVTAADRTWARGLWSVCRQEGWPVHVASDDDVRVIAPDDLAVAG